MGQSRTMEEGRRKGGKRGNRGEEEGKGGGGWREGRKEGNREQGGRKRLLVGSMQVCADAGVQCMLCNAWAGSVWCVGCS